AAVMAGAATWYAVEQAPTARIAVAKHSILPSPVPSSPPLRDGWASSPLTLSVAPPSAPPASAQPSSTPPASAQPSSTPPSTAANAAVLAPAAARYPGAAAVQAVMSQYFQAI